MVDEAKRVYPGLEMENVQVWFEHFPFQHLYSVLPIMSAFPKFAGRPGGLLHFLEDNAGGWVVRQGAGGGGRGSMGGNVYIVSIHKCNNNRQDVP